MLDKTLISEIVGCTFTHDFAEIVLTQLGTETPEVRKGPGTISCDEDGRLKLKLFLTHDLDQQALIDRWNSPAAAGKLLERTDFFCLHATDYQGQVWTCEKLRPKDSVSMDTGSGTVTAVLSYIETTAETFFPIREHNLYIVVPFKPPIPYVMEERNGTYTRTKFTTTLSDETMLSVLEREGYILIHAQAASRPVDERLVLLAIEAMSIGTGESLRSAYKLTQSPDIEVTRLSWTDRQNRTIWGPFNRLENTNEFKEFIQRYVRLCSETPNGYFGFWEKVLYAWHSGLSMAALPLAVYIEGVVKELFPQLMTEEADVITAVETMAKHMQLAAVDPEVIKRCVGAVKGVRDKSVPAALKRLASEGWFDMALVRTWRDVRNKSTHGNDMTPAQGREEIQSVIDGVLGCLYIFYVLLLARIKFEGEVVNYSAHDFPKVRLKPAQALSPAHLPIANTTSSEGKAS
ncbi:MAG: hypothetical protein EOP36_00025 [Rubrivivax sp.]|nr:MAG: hypothetical protein EOP36_00025 [Rubrivivax sp.]